MDELYTGNISLQPEFPTNGKHLLVLGRFRSNPDVVFSVDQLWLHFFELRSDTLDIGRFIYFLYSILRY